MSIDLNWETLTGGPDGIALAESIRDFIHVKFQAVPLPRFIKSVTVHEFAFGKIPPTVVLKDISDPLPDFYEDDYDDAEDEDDEVEEAENHEDDDDDGVPDAIRAAERRRRATQRSENERVSGDGTSSGTGKTPGHVSGTTTPYPDGFFPPHVHSAGLRNAPGTVDLASPFLGLGMSAHHGMPGGASKMNYFGWSGAQTPLAAVARAQHLNGWLDATVTAKQAAPTTVRSSSYHSGSSPSGHHRRHQSQGSDSVENLPTATATSTNTSSLAVPSSHPLREKHSVSTLAPTSVNGAAAATPSRSPTREGPGRIGSLTSATVDGGQQHERNAMTQPYSKSKTTTAAVDDDDDIDGKDEDNSNSGDKKGSKKDGATRPLPEEPRTDDMQAVFRIRYAGDVRLELTAMILLDYPMPSFVGIPLKLNITGLTFDGVGVIAYIRKRVHFCFLSPEDAVAAVGEDDGIFGGGGDIGGDDDDDNNGYVVEAGVGVTGIETSGGNPPPPQYQHSRQASAVGGDDHRTTDNRSPGSRVGGAKGGGGRMPMPGGLLQEIRVESEIGQREGTKQSLKNVGKVEKFVLEQVRRIFEEEFVYPSFWTFLV